MKINFSRVLTDLNGVTINDGAQDVTLKTVALQALLAAYADETQLSGQEKFARYKIADRINDGGEEFSVEEVALLKQLVGKAYLPLVVGRAWELLEKQD